MEDNIFEKWPNWLRYVCAIPFSLFVYLIMYFVMYYSNLWIADANSPMITFFTYMYNSVIGVAVFLSMLHYVIPKHKYIFVLIATSCICTLGLIALYGTYHRADATIWDWISIVLTMGTSALSCVYFYYNGKGETDNNQNVASSNSTTTQTTQEFVTVQTSENTWNEYLEKNFTTEGTRTNMQDMLLTDEQLPKAEEDAVKKLRK